MAPQPIYHLFVYGSLRSGFRSHMYEYISRYFTLLGEAKVKGLLYDLGSYPAGVPAKEETYTRSATPMNSAGPSASWTIMKE
jgi:gamma-glutamylcyclotransferase (GGCT)/AIG2-like uncharacterized protein YtfP